MELTLVHDVPTVREAAPLLLDVLERRNPERADWISDVYSEVLRDLRQGKIYSNHEMVGWLMEALSEGFDKVAPEGQHFVKEGASYGYEPDLQQRGRRHGTT